MSCCNYHALGHAFKLFSLCFIFSRHRTHASNVKMESVQRRRRSAVLPPTPTIVSPTVTRRAHRDIKVAVATAASSAQRYSLSAIVIPKLSISDDGDSSDGAVTGKLPKKFV